MNPPALFDLQVNGFAGVDFQQPAVTLDDLRRAVAALRAHQTQGILLTLITDEIDALCRKFERIEQLCRAEAELAGTICGYHLEGPWLSPEPGYCGAHSADRMRAPSLPDYRRLQAAAGGRIRLITLAPEWPGSPGFISEVTRAGTIVSLGHTNASEGQIDEAIRAGATLCTHLGNGVPMILPRHDNIIQRLLARDELTACLIPDGAHLPPFMLRNLFRAKPPGRVILTTDCMAAAAAPPGRYRLGTMEVESAGGVVRVPGQANLAGSSLTPDRGVANAAAWLRISAADAGALFSTTPARLFGITLPALPRHDPAIP
ncbi:MAG: N-acetylglucosamine-6-phosphate deacetylase [Chthoniobacter sp.]|jgi:N-acetylglucosamine-6-phosphate deacetylase|nr:N-acetylglucosamine-6-phosphate deacetylase [Chthoniobacter sp.]